MNKNHSINIMLGIVLILALAGALWIYLRESEASQQQGMPAEAVTVVTQIAGMEPYVDSIQALGTARANKSVEITAQVSSVVEEILFEEGATVEAGEVLVRMEADEVQANRAAADAALAGSLSLYQRNKEMNASGAVSPSRLQQLEAQMRADQARVAAADATLADHVIRAPFSGRVGLRQIDVGSLAQPGMIIATLDDTDPIKLDFSVPEQFVGTIAPGQTIEARSAAYPAIDFVGSVQSVATRVDPITRAVTVRALLPNPQRLIKPGMFFTVELIRETSPALMVAEQAVVPENQQQFLFVVDQGVAEKREVQTGRRRPGKVEITQGLQAGERFVVAGMQKLRDGDAVVLAEATALLNPAHD